MRWNGAVKARKYHRCGLCNRIIQPGERYGEQRYVEDGTWGRFVECLHCASVIAIIMNGRCFDYLLDYEHDGYSWDSVREFLRESGSLQFARLAVGMRRQWRTFTGDELMPPPTVQRPLCIECRNPIEVRSFETGDEVERALLHNYPQTWCESCDDARIARINAQLASIEDQFTALAGGAS